MELETLNKCIALRQKIEKMDKYEAMEIIKKLHPDLVFALYIGLNITSLEELKNQTMY